LRARDRGRAQILQSLDPALRVPGSFSGERRERGVTELARVFGVSKTTIYRLLANLEGHRYVTQNPVTSRYCLGARLGQVTCTAGPQPHPPAEADPYMEELRERTKELDPRPRVRERS